MSCKKKEEDSYIEKISGVQSAQVAFSTINRGDKASVKLRFVANNGCGEFSRFEETWSENKTTLDVKVYVRYPSDPNTVCTQVITPLNKIYEFTPPDRGTYTIRFFAGGAFITKTITVR
ncbi:hypothetical protein [Microscilla marina]|uniref:Uncharacterized protein n=1 Tax=Microscilla marina ATCC 23134 TaxID=313606 RepID=A1ZFC3_MICM2|nr:hypothetical protein [Microscilla marina]EAY30697.1 hypothetical protein M23134_01021 [Microscilla marina ATCC 23134]